MHIITVNQNLNLSFFDSEEGLIGKSIKVIIKIRNDKTYSKNIFNRNLKDALKEILPNNTYIHCNSEVSNKITKILKNNNIKYIILPREIYGDSECIEDILQDYIFTSINEYYQREFSDKIEIISIEFEDYQGNSLKFLKN